MRLTPTRAEAVDAVTVLDRITGELLSGVNALRWFRAHRIDQAQIATLLEVVCVTQLVLAGCKFVEFYDHFHAVLTSDERTRAKSLLKEISERRLVDYRNTFVGHAWDRERRRILVDSEARAMMDRVTKGDPDATLEWVMPAFAAREDSVYGIVSGLLTSIRERHEVTWEEARGR